MGSIEHVQLQELHWLAGFRTGSGTDNSGTCSGTNSSGKVSVVAARILRFDVGMTSTESAGKTCDTIFFYWLHLLASSESPKLVIDIVTSYA